jgi:hypothetical protein
MSRYASLACPRTRKLLWLGKAIFKQQKGTEGASSVVDRFHIGSAEEPPNYRRDLLNQVLWKFLAEHTGMDLRVVVEGDGFDVDDYVEIGGDSEGDVPFDRYIKDSELPPSRDQGGRRLALPYPARGEESDD